MKVIDFICNYCGNTDPNKAKGYEGGLGYESITCLCCGSFFDYLGEHPAKENSDYMKIFVNRFNNKK